MIREIKQYYCDGIPSENDLMEALKAAESNPRCWIQLSWDFWGPYSIIVTYEDTLETIKDKLPKVYPV